jgi:cellulose synthase/poly-beta-1,6-N-acetylglucosamine synthase-like glycosyltransferase
MQVYYSNPYSVEKNMGKAINDHRKLVPNDKDWIVIQDMDMMYLTPDCGKRIYDALKLDGDKFGLVGCYTNRLRAVHQLHDGKFSNNHDIRDHYRIALTYDKPGIENIGLLGVAGFFMAFRKEVWKRAKGFEENSIVFDTRFNIKVRSLRMKIGLIRGLYVYHQYRIWNDVQPWNDTKHLKL